MWEPDKEWSHDEETERFREELVSRRQKWLHSLLAKCRSADNLLEIKRAVGRFDALTEAIDMTRGITDEGHE